MTTLTTPVKTITYDRLTGDYKMELDGEFVGYAACYHVAEVELDRLAYERLDRAGLEPELTLSASALDAGSNPDEIAAEYAAALPTCAACHTNDHAASTLQPAFCTECVYAMLQGRKNRLDSGHNLTLPDPAECPDVRAPQLVKDLAAATYPAWLLNLADPADDDDDEPADDEEGDDWPPDGLDDVLAPPFGAGAAFILPNGTTMQSIILCVSGVSRVVSAQGVAEALALASVHQITQ